MKQNCLNHMVGISLVGIFYVSIIHTSIQNKNLQSPGALNIQETSRYKQKAFKKIMLIKI